MKRSIKRLLSLNLAIIMALTLSVAPTYAAQEEGEELCAMESGCVDEAVFAKDIVLDAEEAPQEQEAVPVLLAEETTQDDLADAEKAESNEEEALQEQKTAPMFLPAETVLSSVDAYSISVGSSHFSSNQTASGSGWSYDPSDNSLTLNSYNGGTISASGDLVIYTNGNCNIIGDRQSNSPLGYGAYGSIAIEASGNLDIYVENGTLSVTAGSGSALGGDAVSVGGMLYCCCQSAASASFTGGKTTGTQNRGGDALYARSSVFLSGSNITVTGGAGSTSSVYQRSGGCAIYSSKVYVYADCTLMGGTGYIGGPAIYFESYCQFSIVNASVSSGGTGTYAIVSNSDGLTWYYHQHTTISGTNYSFTIAVNRYTLRLAGNGGRTQSGATFTSLRAYYPASYYLGTFSSGFDRDGYTQVAWGQMSGELQSAPTVQETWTDADGASHTVVWETWTESDLIPYDAYYQPTGNTTLYAKWVPTGANDILLNGLFGRFSDGTAFRKTTGTAAKLPKTLSYAYGGDKNVLAWTDTSAASSNDLHIYKESAFYSGGDVIAPNAGAATTLYAWENDGLFARYHATMGQLRQGGSILLQGESSRTVASATSLTTYVPDDSLLIAPGNYEFSGWSLREDGGMVDYLPGERITLSRNVTDLYAVWTPTQLTGKLTDGVTLTQMLKENRVVVSVSKPWCQSNGVQKVICALYDGGKLVRAASEFASGGEITLTLPYEVGNNHTLKLFALDSAMRPACEFLSCVPENLW